jgi:cell division protease FtsH
VETIPYSQFKQYITGGNVSELTIGPESISGTVKGKEEKPGEEFITVRVDDPGLVKELDENKVAYSGYYESKFLSSVLSWIIPIGIFP